MRLAEKVDWKGLTCWNPQGLSRPVMGLLYIYRLNINHILHESKIKNTLYFFFFIFDQGSAQFPKILKRVPNSERKKSNI
jgi:hypothetical protein